MKINFCDVLYISRPLIDRNLSMICNNINKTILIIMKPVRLFVWMSQWFALLAVKIFWENWPALNCAEWWNSALHREAFRLTFFFPMALQPFLWPWPHISVSKSICTDGRTPWTSDQPVARPLPIRRTTQTQKKIHKHTNIHASRRIRT
jgi:hypothetical protein